MFKDKKVIIVGPSSYLEGMGQGGFIDSFDIVVRINNIHDINNPKLVKDLGDLEEKNLAIDHIERLLTQPLFNPDAGEGEEFEEPAGETGETGGETGGADDVAMEPDEEIPEDEQTT